MAKVKVIEPLVEEALINNKASRGDNFILYLEVLKKFIDLNLSIKDVFLNHDLLGIPSLESITRARRKLQEKHPELKDEVVAAIREKEEQDYIDYSRS
jgi:hypothetical protein